MINKVAQFGFLILIALFTVGCDENSGAYQEDIKPSNGEQQINTFSKEDLLELNKEEIIVFYDSISSKIIDLILEDRVYETNPEKRPRLNNVTLDSFSNKLNKESERNVKLYVDTLIQFRNKIINSDFDSKTIADDFISAKDLLLESRFFKSSIIGAGKENDTRYLNLINDIEVHADQLKVKLLNNKKKIESQENERKKKGHVKGNTEIESKGKPLLWICLFGASILLNIFQFLFFRKRIKSMMVYSENSHETEDSNNVIKQEIENTQESVATSMPAILKIEKVKEIINEVYSQKKVILTDEFKDCMKTTSLKFEELKSNTMDALTSKSFKNKEEVLKSLNPKLQTHMSILRDELQGCITKDQMIGIIESSVKVQNFTDKINTAFVSEEDIQSKIEQFKQSVYSELDDTMLREKFHTKMGIIKTDFEAVLDKMIKDNQVYYFPFADANGSLDDEKKTKEIERDSAIKLIIDPNDTSKATFTLLYEEDNMMQAGIMSYDSFLVPICELKSEDFNSTGTRIEQKGDDGTMELEDGYWKVKNMLPIKVI